LERAKKSPELLAPAGELEKLMIAFQFGADLTKSKSRFIMTREYVVYGIC